MKTVYFDCFAGISGDMALAALTGLGNSHAVVEKALKSLPVSDWKLSWEKVQRRGLAAGRAVVTTSETHAHRGLKEIIEILDAGRLTQSALALAREMFTSLAQAEARVHGVDIENIHFHEVGALDAIIDIAGCAVAADALGVVTWMSSPVRTGHGTVRMAHGEYPIPAPGTAALLEGIPVFAGEFGGEWTTPTGAAILTTLCSSYGQLPMMRIEAQAYGAGSRDHDVLPNVLRVLQGEQSVTDPSTVLLLQAQVDDMTGEQLGYLGDRLTDSAALDWYFTPIMMKKNRPGQLITVLCREPDREGLTDLLFRESSTIGVRRQIVEREELQRDYETVTVQGHVIRIKTARYEGRLMNAAPELEDCRSAAARLDRPLKDILQAATAAWQNRSRE